MHVKRGSQRRVSATPWMCSTVDVSERSWDCRGKIMSPMRSWSGMQALSEIVQTRRLRLAGHAIRLPDIRPARVAMTWIRESGGRTRGRPQKTRRTSFKEDLHGMNLTWHGAKRAANDRHRWTSPMSRPGQKELSLSKTNCNVGPLCFHAQRDYNDNRWHDNPTRQRKILGSCTAPPNFGIGSLL